MKSRPRNQKYFGESTLLKTQVVGYHKAFSEGLENLHHKSFFVYNGNIEKVQENVLENRRVGLKEIAEDLKISCGSPQHILVNV